jgi:hypothetical protein
MSIILTKALSCTILIGLAFIFIYWNIEIFHEWGVI